MPDIKVKGYSGNDLVYEDVEKVYFASATGPEKLPYSYGEAVDNIPIPLDFTKGDQTIIAPAGTLVRSAVIQKPEGLKPENIRKDVDIGGVTGTLVGDTEEVVVDLDFQSGAEEVILEEQTIPGFEYSSDFGAFTPGYVKPAAFVLEVGDSYRVVWDGEEFNCVAFPWTFSGMNMVAIGNGSSFGASGNNEPFLINYNAAYDNSQIFGTTEGTHTVAIYHETGGVADMEVTPSAEGKVLSKVVIAKPETLIPENIAEGVTIAGVEGELKSGGGSFPAGVYLSAAPFRGLTVAYTPFSLNGDVFAASPNIAGSGYLKRIDKWNGSSWATLLSTTDTNGLAGAKIDSAVARVEYHGKVHFVGNQKHAVFDGNTFTLLNAPPSTTEGVSMAVYQDKLVVFFTSTGNLYEWDEANDTWVVMGQISSDTYTKYNLFVINGDLYATKTTSCYRWTNGALVQTNSNAITQGWSLSTGFVYKGCIYYVYSQTTYATVYKYNPVDDECSVVGSFPPFTTSRTLVIGNEPYYMGQTHSSYSSYNPCFKVNIVEESI